MHWNTESKAKAGDSQHAQWCAVQGVLLLRDNTHSHSAAAIVSAFRQLKFEFLPHPPYSQDLAPSDYHLFGPVNKASRGRRFASDDDVEDMVNSWLWSWRRSSQIGSNGLCTATQCALKKCVIMWRNCTLSICHGFFYTKQLRTSLCFLIDSWFVHFSESMCCD